MIISLSVFLWRTVAFGLVSSLCYRARAVFAYMYRYSSVSHWFRVKAFKYTIQFSPISIFEDF
jgi:hypothetical protein